MTERVSVRHLTKRYDATIAVADVPLDVPPGARLAPLSPSGRGKSTMLRLIAGLERSNAGDRRLGTMCAASTDTATPLKTRRVGMVFQDYTLHWPECLPPSPPLCC
ncbi:MAG: ATP-binding cassette domain-containing protein [Chloroflexales bacterium]|nr:ATP-binding cassette domain-containing protein [Chloroflexales bacterium]